MTPRRVNIASHLTRAAQARPDVDAVIAARRDGGWNRLTFAQLEARSTALAASLIAWSLLDDRYGALRHNAIND